MCLNDDADKTALKRFPKRKQSVSISDPMVSEKSGKFASLLDNNYFIGNHLSRSLRTVSKIITGKEKPSPVNDIGSWEQGEKEKTGKKSALLVMYTVQTKLVCPTSLLLVSSACLFYARQDNIL
ncbi:hypothetical protein HNY73_006302 [Argiope bruennichi]|uniref:Uncharacterized protein n=1 Tax=Argiope bruennichi TaxID=94029 RepID=A0A8T0FKA9_ARGBR|nr:hypothetical protein HNY73_006302 [Argiope bruennichi]